MKLEQLKNSGLIVLSNLLINLTSFLRQVILAWFLGVSAQIDILLIAQIVPAIIQAMIGGGAGEISVIKGGDRPKQKGSFIAIFIFICLLLVSVLGVIYYLSLDSLVFLFKLKPESYELFRKLSLVFILNMIPGTFTSILRPHLYSKGFYKFFTYSSVISQFSGVIFILITLKMFGIYAFAFSMVLANTLNAIWFSFRAGISYKKVLYVEEWKVEIYHLMVLLKRVFSVSLMTIFNYLGTFWERTLSVRYLSGGYLSSLNYSKTLSDLPSSVLLSSVLTTSYIEQVKLYKEDYGQFTHYTKNTLSIIIYLGLTCQIILLGVAPLIIILLFRRGNFNNKAVESTLVIFNILTVGFLPKLLYGYFSRTMYILGEYRKLLMASFVRLILQVSIMIAFISNFSNTIPFAILAGNLFIAVLLYYLVGKKLEIKNWYKFPVQIFIISIVSLLMYRVHTLTLHYYVDKTTIQIMLIYLPIIFVVAALLLLYLIKTPGGKSMYIRIKDYVKKRSKKKE